MAVSFDNISRIKDCMSLAYTSPANVEDEDAYNNGVDGGTTLALEFAKESDLAFDELIRKSKAEFPEEPTRDYLIGALVGTLTMQKILLEMGDRS